MKNVLRLAAIGEAITGLALLIVPSLVSWLLLGTELTGVSIPIARVTGIALIGLGIACWPGCAPPCGMLAYSTLVTLYLTYLLIRGEWVGPLLWLAVAFHVSAFVSAPSCLAAGEATAAQSRVKGRQVARLLNRVLALAAIAAVVGMFGLLVYMLGL